MWRCPHCGTPQQEAARCWLCGRSSTTCSTCRHFQRSLAARVGYCGLDRRHLPLRGDEHRGCWAPPLARVTRRGARELPVVAGTTPAARLPRDFVPVGPEAAPGPAIDPEPWLDRSSLFGEGEL